MRTLIYFIVATIFLYMGVSTIFMDFHFVGKLGTSFGKFNRETFGALAFIYPFLFLYPLFITYKKKLNAKEMLSFSVMLLLTFFTLLLIQALLLPKGYDGKIGAVVIAFFTPFIGTIGVWFLVMLLVGLLYFLFQQEIKLLIHKKYTKERLIIDEKVSIKKEKIEPLENDQKEQEKRVVHEIQNQLREKKPSIKLVKNPFASQESQENTEIKKVKKQVKLVNEKEKLQKASGLTSSSATSVKPATKEMQEAQESFNKRPTQVKIVSELEENRKFLESIEKGSFEKPQDFLLPKIEFLQPPPKKRSEINETVIDKKVQELIEKLKQFKIEGDVVRTYSGPLVTTFEFKPAPHIKVSKILNLADDLAMALRAQTIRIQAPIPGKDVVGIEIPNDEFETIYLREIIESDIFKKAASPLTLALGKDIVGKPFVTDLKKLPHLLIAGTTGSGKSVGINAMLVSLLYRNSPDRLKLMMIDPKMLEFSIYNDIPHLLTPVITNSKQAIVALSNMVAEMERRYRLMSQYKTKNIEGFNKKAKKEGLEELPYIVVIIDELADLMMTSGKDVEYSIARLAQMARAAGIHLIVATQRPSVDVVTGLIKANLPSRISFRVGQKIDSKVILDSIGAESLLGRGDMLFTPPGSTGLIRLHAPWISEEEIEKIVEFLKAQREPQYDEKFLAESLESGSSNGGRADNDELDELYEEAKKIVLSERKTSISYLQRRLQIGYNRAARIVEQLENMGVLSAPNAKGNREILL